MNKKVILVDFFDTIIRRKICQNRLIKLWAEALTEELQYSVMASDIYEARKAAEICLNNYYKWKSDYEISAAELYSYLFDILVSKNCISHIYKNEFLEKARICEINLEKKVQVLNKDLVKKLYKLKKQGKKIICVSDHHFGKEVLLSYLDNLNASNLIDKFYVSADFGVTKIRGGLYDIILRNEKLSAEDCVMIGDNKIGDIKNARKAQISAKKINYSKSKKLFKTIEIERKKELSNIFNTYNNSVFSNYSILLYYFCEKLYAHAIKNKINKLLFFSREGEFLLKVFNEYQAIFQKRIKTEYVFVSRSSLYCASLKDLKIETFDLIFNMTKVYSVFEFCKAIGFSNQEIESLNIKDNLNKIENFSGSEAFIDLKNNKKFISIYNFKRKQQFEYVNLYFKHLMDEWKTAFVDIGWRGTMQDLLLLILKKDLVGFYYGIDTSKKVCNSNIKDGLVFSTISIKNDKIQNALMFRSFNLEYILKASHSRVISYEKKNDLVIPVLAEDASAQEFEMFVNPLQEEIFYKFKLLKTFFAKAFLLEDEKRKLCASINMMIYSKMKYFDYKLLNYFINSRTNEFGNENLKRKKFNYLSFLKFKAYNNLKRMRYIYGN